MWWWANKNNEGLGLFIRVVFTWAFFFSHGMGCVCAAFYYWRAGWCWAFFLNFSTHQLFDSFHFDGFDSEFHIMGFRKRKNTGIESVWVERDGVFRIWELGLGFSAGRAKSVY